ncbi:MAG: hypothetical protein K9N21_19055, partial [Deltaproteobacteria bacterium]|nr:hypothetical protein [Deltaproteobacteria bacterium]
YLTYDAKWFMNRLEQEYLHLVRGYVFSSSGPWGKVGALSSARKISGICTNTFSVAAMPRQESASCLRMKLFLAMDNLVCIFCGGRATIVGR